MQKKKIDKSKTPSYRFTDVIIVKYYCCMYPYISHRRVRSPNVSLHLHCRVAGIC